MTSSSSASPSEACSDWDEGLYTGLAPVQPVRRTQLPEAHLAPYINAPACDSCRQITTKALISAAGHRLHTIDAAKIGATNDCPLCTLIVDQIDQLDGPVLDHEMIILRVANVTGTPYRQDELFIQSQSEQQRHNLWPTLGIYTDEEDAASALIPGRRMAQEPDPASSILLARAWIDLSKEWMAEDFDLPKALPKRLIYVGRRESPTVYLKEFPEVSGCDEGPRGSYVCLSHRWDNASNKYTTTIDNIDDRKEGIEFCSLPKTYQDAITITRALGQQYIWIDTFCILQGSEPDWAEESAKMGSYYGSSVLTIGAGVRSSEGLFGKRVFEIDYHKVDLHEPSNSRLYFTNVPVNNHIGDEQFSLLRTRARTFQEEMLSPRYLGFQRNQMYYRCGEYVYFESGCKEWLRPLQSVRNESEFPLFPDRLLEEDWFSSVIVDYSSRQLSSGSDKLPAISGIAHERQRLRGGHYVAGLRKENLPKDLCWSKEFATGPCLKPIEYRAPSWSWAAIDGWVLRNHIDASEIEADVVHVSTELKGRDPMGPVSGGVLVICGVFRCGSISRERRPPRDDFTITIPKYDFVLSSPNRDAADDIVYTFVPDTSGYSTVCATLWFFNITSKVGLALLPVSPSHPQYSMHTFERVGLIEVEEDYARGAWPEVNLRNEIFRTTITIV
ncbi:heterokaryon incompatibility protein-domain-containing protein [Cadophora sp. MPI-SDFR-AT-0126]|nr:heterokaryon incompatibility protein-domain-containing protein [Leotiomycetes sp. MPI-SDFR-AT-0126]